ncbi:MAG: ParM/StbA family protein, partial [Acidiphilium sp.]|nr:ParM/StbA family protein [Acidiphilium sp.]
YFSGGQVIRTRIDLKIANLKAGIAMMGSQNPMPRIVDVKVGCQGLAAFFDYTLDDRGKPRGEALESVVVVDIGGSTTDIVSIVRGGQTIDQSASGAARLGVLDVHTLLTEKLTADLGFPVRLTPAAIDRACRTGQIKINRADRDVSGLVREAVGDVGAQIVREVERRIGKAATVDAVLFVGGGAALFKDVVQHWSGVEVVADGEMANARGLLKYARSRG